MYLCFDLGGTFIKAGIVDPQGKITIKTTVPTKVNLGLTGILKQFQDLKRQLLKDLKIKGDLLKGVGVGIPGFVLMEKGMVINAPNLGWKNIYIKEKIKQYLNLPVFITNDANAAALGEMWQGAGKGCRNLLCITLGTGIGGGVIIDGKIHNGAFGLAGEIGHIQVKAENGRMCNCGKSGCLETESSGSALVYYGDLAKQEGKRTILSEKVNLTGKDILEAASNKDQVALNIIDNAMYYLAKVLANIYLVIAPEKIIIGGGVAKGGDILFRPLIEWFNKFTFEFIEGQKIIIPAQLGNDAGIIGLAQLVKEQQKIVEF